MPGGRVLYMDAGRVTLAEAASIPLYVATHYPGGYEAVVVAARFGEGGVSAGALNIVWSGETAVRRASGGVRVEVQPGDYHLTIVYGGGSLRECEERTSQALRSGGFGVHGGLGKAAGRPFLELYSGRDPAPLLDEVLPVAGLSRGEALDPALLGDAARTIMDPSWLDPVEGEGGPVAFRVQRGLYYFGVVGYASDGLIVASWPDSNIHVYPAGAARRVFRELRMVPPSMLVAFHAANGFISSVEYAGVEAEHILEAFKGYITEAERVAGGG